MYDGEPLTIHGGFLISFLPRFALRERHGDGPLIVVMVIFGFSTLYREGENHSVGRPKGLCRSEPVRGGGRTLPLSPYAEINRLTPV